MLSVRGVRVVAVARRVGRVVCDRDERQDLPRCVRCEKGRRCAGAVIGGCHLDDVCSDQIDAGEAPEKGLSFSRAESTDLRRPRSRGEGGIAEVHVKAEESLLSAHPLFDEVTESFGTELPECFGR